MTNIYKKYLPALAILLMVLSFAMPSTGKGKKQSVDIARQAELQRKADYMFMEAARQNAIGADDAYFELLRGAYDLDSTDTSVGQTLGYFLLILGQNDSVMAEKGFNMMRRHFNEHPEDYYGAIFYGMVNNQLGNNDEAIRVWTVVDSLNPTKPDVTIKLVEALQAKGDTASLRQSLSVLRRLERAEGKDLGLSSHTIRAMLQLRDTAGVLSELSSLLASSPTSAQYKMYAGDVFMVLQEKDSAARYYDMACAADSTDGFAYYKRAQFYLQNGDSLNYERQIDHALRQESLDFDAKLELLRDYVGKLYADSLKRPQITSLFETMLQQHPHEAQIRDLYASYLIMNKDLKGAIEQQEYAVDADLSNAQRWRTIMSLYGQLDDSKKAIETGQRALEFVPDDTGVNLLLGANYQQLKDSPKAMEYYRKALTLTDSADNATRSQIIASIGDIFYTDNEVDSAFQYYQKAVALDPDNLLALNNFAYYLAEKNRDLDLAERYSAICVRANPDNDTAIDTYAWIFYKKKDYIKAKEWIDQAVELQGDEPAAEILDHAGDIYYMNQEPAKALEFWEKALQADPENKDIKAKIKRKSPF